ncbi:MAG: hypothetical protein ACLQVN_01255 [Bryobacteraceae bacterium]
MTFGEDAQIVPSSTITKQCSRTLSINARRKEAAGSVLKLTFISASVHELAAFRAMLFTARPLILRAFLSRKLLVATQVRHRPPFPR